MKFIPMPPPPPEPDDNSTVADLKAYIRYHLKDKEPILMLIKARAYHRPLNSGQAVSMIRLYRLVGRNWAHLSSTIGTKSREETKLAHYGLIESAHARRVDGAKAGVWRITEKGELFVKGLIKVPSHAWFGPKNTLIELDYTKMVNIKQVLGMKFDYQELMYG